MKIAASKIGPKTVGRRLLEFSHVGETPDERDRTDRLAPAGTLDVGSGTISAIRTSDDDNHVVVILGQLVTDVARDPDGNVVMIDGRPARAPVVPPTGEIEIGFDTNGWIEVED